jgi:hypothetical protein
MAQILTLLAERVTGGCRQFKRFTQLLSVQPTNGLDYDRSVSRERATWSDIARYGQTACLKVCGVERHGMAVSDRAIGDRAKADVITIEVGQD